MLERAGAGEALHSPAARNSKTAEAIKNKCVLSYLLIIKNHHLGIFHPATMITGLILNVLVGVGCVKQGPFLLYENKVCRLLEQCKNSVFLN